MNPRKLHGETPEWKGVWVLLDRVEATLQRWGRQPDPPAGVGLAIERVLSHRAALVDLTRPAQRDPDPRTPGAGRAH